ncbi:ABC transporter substrate-binding protein, partial [Candidatus Woesearchaeota archaeon]|nr:ABC transporter substrate-binding protein [Candidatus Woesearchaeota archaeon]
RKAAEPDLIFFPAYTDDIITGLKQMKELGVEAQILGADAWDDPKIFTDAGDAAEGIIYLVPFTPFPEEFKQKVLAITGGDSVVVGTPQAYDAVYIFADAMKKVGTDPEAIKNALYEMPEYQGVSGSIEFDENGDLVYAEYAKKTFKNGELVDYE